MLMCLSLLVDTALLPLEDLGEGEWLVGSTSSLVELAHELDPMETHGMQEDLQGVHHEQDAEDSEHVAESEEEEVEDSEGGAHGTEVGARLGEEDLQEHFTELSVSE